MNQDRGDDRISRTSNLLRVLLIEDTASDAELCRRALKKYKSEVHLDVVSTLRDFSERLRSSTYDIILSDYTLGGWTATDALKFLRKERFDIPFILVTGTLGEEKAVACIKDGMADFILKDRLERLPIAVSRALEDKRLLEEYRKAETSVRDSEAKFRTLADAIPAAIFIEKDGQCRYANQTAATVTGYSRAELGAMSFSQLIHPDSRDAVAEHQAKRDKSAKSAYRLEIMIRPKASEARWLDVTVGTFTDEGAPATLITAFDVTERVRTNRELQNDAITGLPNRRHLAAIFDTETSRSRRTEHKFSVLLLFLQNMEQLTRKYGQLAANQVLRQAARTTRLHCRNLDTIGRIASDQFAMVLPETEVGGAQILGSRIAARLSDPGQELPLSCIYAAAEFPSDGERFEEILKTANRQIISVSQK